MKIIVLNASEDEISFLKQIPDVEIIVPLMGDKIYITDAKVLVNDKSFIKVELNKQCKCLMVYRYENCMKVNGICSICPHFR